MSTFAVLYIVSLILGGGLLLLSLFFGSQGDADLHADLSADVSSAGHMGGDLHHGPDLAHNNGHGLSLAGWFSVQFAVYFLAVFGLIGTTLTYVTHAAPGAVVLSALAGGVIIGQLVHQAIRALKRSGAGSDLTSEDFLNQPGRVTIAFGPSRRGEIAVPSRNGERFLAAVARRNDDQFKVGDRVVVVAFANGVAEVLSKQEYEFVSSDKAGGKS